MVKEEDIADVVREADISDVVRNDDISDIVREADLDSYAKVEALDDYATNADLEALEGKVTGVYHYRGSVANLEALQVIENPAAGDVYNLEDTGMNAAWTGEVWDEFGTVVDLSPYALSEDIQVITIPELEALLYSGKVGVVSDAKGLAAMLANDKPEVAITMNDDISNTSIINVPEGKSVILDLAGNNYNGGDRVFQVAGDLTIKNGIVEGNARSVVVYGGGTLTLDNASVISTSDCAISVQGEGSEVIVDGGEVKAQEFGILATTGATITINGGEVVGIDNCPMGGNGTKGQGNTTIVMNGGKLVAHIESAGYIACGVYLPNEGTFVMNGGEIVSDGAGIVMRGGKVELNGGTIIANGASGVKGKVGDSRVVVGPYAVVYDANSKYPAMDTLELVIGKDMVLQGTDGDIGIVLPDGVEANITDNR